jgi:excisionase family DNA binding protein
MRPRPSLEQLVPLLVSRAEACHLLGISLPTLEKLIDAGEVPSVPLRRRKMIPREFLIKLASGSENRV